MNEHDRDPVNLRRDFIAGGIALLAAHLMPVGLLVKRWNELPPIGITALVVLAIAPIPAFFFTLRRNEELKEAFRRADASKDKQLAELLESARADLRRIPILMMSLNLLWATAFAAVLSQLRH
jgi:hypothetical protein